MHLDHAAELLEPLLATIDEIRGENFSGEAVVKANGFYHQLLSSEFLVALTITRHILHFTRSLPLKLQERLLDVAQSNMHVANLLSTLKNLRKSVDTFHDEKFFLRLSLAEKFEVSVSKPRQVARSVFRSSVDSDSASDYYKKSVTIPLLDHLITELDSRFTTSSTCELNGHYLIPSNHEGAWKARVCELIDAIEDDLPHPPSAVAEIGDWEAKRKCLSLSEKPTDLLSTLKATDRVLFPNVFMMIVFSLTLPVTSCECER